MSTMDDTEKVREMLTMEQVLAMIPFDRVYLFRLEKERLFPKAHFVTPKKRLWFKDEVIQWQHDLADPNSDLSQAVQLKLQRAKGE
jgi:prophage regulatory protein